MAAGVVLGLSRLLRRVGAADVGGAVAEVFYPGDDVVDWMAVDGYNWGASQAWSSWRSPAAALGPMVVRLRALSARPLAITETASTTATAAGASLAAKSESLAVPGATAPSSMGGRRRPPGPGIIKIDALQRSSGRR